MHRGQSNFAYLGSGALGKRRGLHEIPGNEGLRCHHHGVVNILRRVKESCFAACTTKTTAEVFSPLLAKQMKLKRLSKTIIILIALIPAGTVFYLMFIFPYQQFRSPLAYPIFRMFWNTEVIGHFPEETGNGSEAVGFFYWHGLMQAPSVLELRLRFDRKHYNRELSRLEKFPVTEDAKKYAHSWSERLWTAEEDAHKFQVRILHCRPTFYGEELSWNHGSGYGYGWNNIDGEIIYWIISW